MNDYQTFIHLSRYARWDDDKQRRETWAETVGRYIDFFAHKIGDAETEEEIRESICRLDVMPSMRALATAGPALARDNIAAYNCGYSPIEHPRDFAEALHILMNGTGEGFSVEREYINKLPEVPHELEEVSDVIVVGDSKEGWAKALRTLIFHLYNGEIPQWDVSRIRAKGERLKTFGGRASGPEPLVRLLRTFVHFFKQAQGRKLNNLEVHDLVCHIADVVVVGGVRRSALISLSNLSDDRMRVCKSGRWFDVDGQRSNANNSVAYTSKPDVGAYMKEFVSLYESKSGERGIFSRPAAQRAAGRSGRRNIEHDFGCNPCSEIILRPRQFCNLSEVVVRAGDTAETLKKKVRVATIIGTLQATLTDFKFISKKWKDNCEEERLLGASLTGIMDHPQLSKVCEETEKLLEELNDVAVETNAEWADKLGINRSTAITCVKPSGTVSQLVNAASGIHPRYSTHYIRSVRQDKKDPISQFMIDQGVPYEDNLGNAEQYVFYFPEKAPEGCITRDEVSALYQLEHWLMFGRHWCEHKASITVYVREHEWPDVQAWVYNHFDEMSGVSFLPFDDHVYQQPPYDPCTEEEYNERVKAMPTIDWEALAGYEQDDNTLASQELACVGGACEI